MHTAVIDDALLSILTIHFIIITAQILHLNKMTKNQRRKFKACVHYFL